MKTEHTALNGRLAAALATMDRNYAPAAEWAEVVAVAEVLIANGGPKTLPEWALVNAATHHRVRPPFITPDPEVEIAPAYHRAVADAAAAKEAVQVAYDAALGGWLEATDKERAASRRGKPTGALAAKLEDAERTYKLARAALEEAMARLSGATRQRDHARAVASYEACRTR